MCDTDEYLKVVRQEGNKDLLEIWRRGTMRMLLFAGGAICAGRGYIEGAIEGGDDFVAIALVLGGIYIILEACKPGPKGGD